MWSGRRPALIFPARICTLIMVWYFVVMINESQINKPEHKLDAGLSSLDMKLDYMGTSICMMQLSDLVVTFNDEWIVDPRGGAQTPTVIPIATNRYEARVQLPMFIVAYSRSSQFDSTLFSQAACVKNYSNGEGTTPNTGLNSRY